ncbi:MAG: RNA ligase family protein, partial [Myxococcota bacterium]
GATVGGPWVATEKVHGAQLVVAVARGTVRFGKRKAWLEDDDGFFGWRSIRSEIEASATEAGAAVGARQLWLYGELHGGRFGGASLPGLQPVQTGIDYAPDLHWLVFDAIVASDHDDRGEWLADHELRALNLLVPPCIERGPRGVLARLPVAFPSRVPAMYGLLGQPENLAEGLVLKPDARMPVGTRPVYKRKLPDFDDVRFAGAENWNPGHLDLSVLLAWLPRLVTEARVASARSKVGTAQPAIVDEVALDVAIDLADLFRESWEACSDADQQTLIDRVRELAEARARERSPM